MAETKGTTSVKITFFKVSDYGKNITENLPYKNQTIWQQF